MNNLQYLIASFGRPNERRSTLTLALRSAELPGNGWWKTERGNVAGSL